MKDSFKDSFGQGPYVKDSCKVSLGFKTLWKPRLIKDTKNVKKRIGFVVFYVKRVGKPLVLLCFPSKLLNNH